MCPATLSTILAGLMMAAAQRGGPPVLPIPQPIAASQFFSFSGAPILPGGDVFDDSVLLEAKVAASDWRANMVACFEVTDIDAAFTGAATFQATMDAPIQSVTADGLDPGSYKWQTWISENGGNGPVLAFGSADPDFVIQPVAPPPTMTGLAATPSATTDSSVTLTS